MSLITDPSARQQLHVLLDQYRPDRYDPTDKSWQKPICEMVEAELTDAEARELAAARIVSTAEANATRSTNKLLREIARHGAIPLEWVMATSWPLAVDDNERVTLRAAMPDDFERFANRERRAASLDFTARNESCEGALLVAEAMSSLGLLHGGDLTPTEAA